MVKIEPVITTVKHTTMVKFKTEHEKCPGLPVRPAGDGVQPVICDVTPAGIDGREVVTSRRMKEDGVACKHLPGTTAEIQFLTI